MPEGLADVLTACPTYMLSVLVKVISPPAESQNTGSPTAIGSVANLDRGLA